MPDRAQRGFTAIELMIAIVSVAVVSAAAIPTLQRSRMSANEASASGALKTIAAAQTDYNNNSSPHSFADSLAELADAGYLDQELGAGEKQGFLFTVTTVSGLADVAWAGAAVPRVPQRSGQRSFFIDETGIVLSRCPPGQHAAIDPVTLMSRCVPDAEPGVGTMPDLFEAVVAIEELNFLSDGQALEMARENLRDPAYVASILRSFDSDGDGRLTLAEALDFRLPGGTAVGPTRAPAFGEGSTPDAILQRYQRRLAAQLQLDAAHERNLPLVPLDCVTGFPEALLDQVAGNGPLASLDILQALVLDLNPLPPPVGDMTGDASTNQRRKARLLSSVQAMSGRLRFHQLAELRADLMEVRHRADGRRAPADWITGPAAGDVVSRVDATLALLAATPGAEGGTSASR